MQYSVAKQRRLAPAHSQRGISFIGVCFLVAVLVFAGYVVAKSVPISTEYFAVQRALKQAAAGSTVDEVRQNFARQASIDYLDQYADPIQPQDLMVSKVNDQVLVEVEYVREIPLFGPAFLTYKLSASSK